MPRPASRCSFGPADVSSIDVESLAPTVLWRMFRTGREHVRAVLLPGGPPFILAFFANEQMDRAENYDTMDLAVFRANEIKRSLAKDGWSEELLNADD